MSKLPPNRPPGIIDLLGSADPGSPEDGVPDASWRADALGRSLHSRLADEVRAPLDDPDPARAELVCARIARSFLGDYAPAVLLLSATKRRRLQSLTAWTATLFDLALRPGLAGLDGDRLAQINAWEFQTEEALDPSPAGQPTQPIFVAMARADREQPWPRAALDDMVAAARTTAVARPASAGEPGPPGGQAAAAAFLEALFGAGHTQATTALAQLVIAATRRERPETRNTRPPPGWRRAIGYGRRVVEFKRTSEGEVDRPLGLGARLRILVSAAIFR